MKNALAQHGGQRTLAPKDIFDPKRQATKFKKTAGLRFAEGEISSKYSATPTTRAREKVHIIPGHGIDADSHERVRSSISSRSCWNYIASKRLMSCFEQAMLALTLSATRRRCPNAAADFQ